MKQRVIAAVVGGAVFFSALLWLVAKEHDGKIFREIKPGCLGPAKSAAAFDSLELREQRFMSAKRFAFDRCLKEGGFPVMGFEAVVCLAPAAQLWATQMPEWSVGPPANGSARP